MIIDDILSYDFSEETDVKRLKDAVVTLQSYCNDTRDTDTFQPPAFECIYNDLDETFQEDWVKDWIIEDDGTIRLQYGNHYEIAGNRLTETNWLSHILEKDLGKGGNGEQTFYSAYIAALKKIGIKKVEIDVQTGKWNFIN